MTEDKFGGEPKWYKLGRQIRVEGSEEMVGWKDIDKTKNTDASGGLLVKGSERGFYLYSIQFLSDNGLMYLLLICY